MTRAVSNTFSLTVSDPSALPLWLQQADGGSLPPVWKWVDVPASNLSSVPPDPVNSVYGGLSYKIGAWNGATLKRTGSIYMLGAAGGHGDYAGNEVNSIALNVDSPAWIERKPRSAVADVIKFASVYLDDTRAAIHTYCSTQFDQANNRMLIVSGGGIHGTWPSFAEPASDYLWRTTYATPQPSPELQPLMAFDLTTDEWLAPDLLGLLPSGIGGTSAMTCSSPDGTKIYSAAAGWSQIQQYTVASDTWASIGASGYIAGHGSAMDPTRNEILIVGSNTGAATPRLFDITAGANQSITWSGLGASAIQVGGYPGVVYDEENDQYIVGINNGSVIDVFTVNPDTYVIAAPSVLGTKPAARQNGLHNALQYVPELKGVVIANTYTGNMKFMRVA